MTHRAALGLAALVLAVACAAAAAPAKRPAARPSTAAHRDTAAARTMTAVKPDSAARPSFAGRWKLSIARSSFGKIPGGQPTARTDVIVQMGSRVRQTLYLLRGAQRDTTVYVYTTDGAPTVNHVDGRDIRSVVTWEGAALHLKSTAKLFTLETSLDERWMLSPDARTLTFARHVKYGFGEGDQKLVFERE